MLRRCAAYFSFIRSVTDIVMIFCIWIAAYYIRFYSGGFSIKLGIPDIREHLLLMPLVAFTCYVTCIWSGLYRSQRVRSLFNQFLEVFRATVLSGLFMLAFFYYLMDAPYSRILLALFIFMLFFGLFFSHLGVMSILRLLRKRGYNLRHYVVIGAGEKGRQLVRDIEAMPWSGLNCVRFIDNDASLIGTKYLGIPIDGPIERIPELVTSDRIDEVCMTLSGSEAHEAFGFLEYLQASGVTVRIIPDWGNLISLSDPVVVPVGSQVLFSAGDSPLGGYNIIMKRLFDLTIAMVTFVAVFVPMLLIALLIRLTGRGPVFYRQTRVGADQREFKILKFRTMKIDADMEDPPQWSKEDDSRLTVLGKLLRRMSLDELPQLVNVIAGQMSLVGPRPERPYFVKRFSEDYKKYMLRHKVKAGMTGWAQVNGFRGNSSVRKRLVYDLYYVRNWSFMLDLWILLRTPLHVIRGKNAR
ncbi:MAG: undecaprenyl-phosphate glucose phosphotransferase [Sedimentisphaerales bacterium]|nr:undecaprenyl-phosphate glucose phosphotransferase [Sedimentisphaerales bacterium]